MKDIKIPDIGENVDSGDVVSVLVSEGDMVKADQGIIEVETDKAVVEIPWPDSGKIVEITVCEGDTIKPGQTIGKLDPDGEAEEKTEKAEEAEEDKEPEEEKASEKEEQQEQEKEKEQKAEAKQKEQKKQEKQEEARRDEVETGKETAKEKETKAEPKESGKSAPAAPSVRRLARELGVEIGSVSGSGPGGRITSEDVKNHVRGLVEGKTPSATPQKPIGAGQPELPDFSKWGEIRREKASKIRSAIAKGTSHSWNLIPHVTQFDRADITQAEKFRKKHGKKAEVAGGKLTITPILIKVITAALKEFPRFNTSLDLEKGELIYKNYYHIGVAVDTSHGLLMPVIKDADQKSLLELSVEIVELVKKAYDRKISQDELDGGTFTISNQGGIGGTDFTPLIYWPQAAILGVSRAEMRPVFDDGEFVPRLILPLSLSYDHRIIDGADAARFLSWVVEALENPFLMDLG